MVIVWVSNTTKSPSLDCLIALLGVMELVNNDTNSFEVDVLLGGQLVMLMIIVLVANS